VRKPGEPFFQFELARLHNGMGMAGHCVHNAWEGGTWSAPERAVQPGWAAVIPPGCYCGTAVRADYE